MMKDDELWLKKIKERLDDYSEPLPDAGWERLEKALPTSPSMSVGTKKNILFRRWAMTAAAVALVAVSSVSLWLMQSPVMDDVRRSAEPALAVIPDVLPEQAKPAIQGEQPKPVIRRVVEQEGASHHHPLVAQRLETEGNKTGKDVGMDINEELPVSDGTGKEAEDTVASGQVAESAPSTQEKDNRRISRPSGKDKLHLPAEKKSSKGEKGWAVGLSVGNTSGLVSQDNAGGGDMQLNSGPMFSDKLDMTNVSNGVLSIPVGQELVFAGGVPYLRKNTRAVRDVKHKQPISFGVSVRKSLPKNFSVETGVTYTMLASEITYEGNAEKVDQKLHYIGIPVRANWNFINNKNFTMYVSAGGAIEKCVYGKIASEKETVKPVQLSVMGAVGAQYNISNRIGIYVEPGVSYFFDDGSAVETIRKENPTNFTLQAGVRLTY
ncbi:porin family protein [uncultured Bacteroides sp.]|uniref:porin family protein n=1 Tax=uncultured Bacteroides sp. TaxID=162156 RepID=UPI00260016A1|nr:porin family protein [uncultured Bacteroides sp.]